MRLDRLRIRRFAAIGGLDVAFGPGLNVLYGPNEIGKSTLAEAIRLALLLPCTAKYHATYLPWSGAGEPRIELTFETEAGRVWRVRKQFGSSPAALLEESRNGRDFARVQSGRAVEARLREVLRWGIPEPGGSSSGKGLPASFLATALLSTQARVTDILHQGLGHDPSTSGKERIAAALQAATQDPLFVAMLRQARARRDEAYTEKGAKKTARGSVLKVAADRVEVAREEMQRLQQVVDESEVVERRLRELVADRLQRDQERTAAEEGSAAVRRLAQQAADRAAAEEEVRQAREAVLRIQKLEQEVAESENRVRALAGVHEQAGWMLRQAQAAEAAAGEALAAAEEAARSVVSAQGEVDRRAAIVATLAKTLTARTAVAGRRAAIVVPAAERMAAMWRLERELASARGALDVGMVTAVVPATTLRLRVRQDGVPADVGVISQALEVVARREVEIDVAGVATVRVRGGSPEAQERASDLEGRWRGEVAPHLLAAGVKDLEALAEKLAEARDLDSRVQSLDGEVETLRRQIADLGGAADSRREAYAALADLPSAVAAETAAADDAMRATLQEQEKAAAELASLQERIEAKRARLVAALAEARQALASAGHEVEAARKSLAQAMANRAAAGGELVQLRRRREAEDLVAAERLLRQATARLDGLPAPERRVSPEEVKAAGDALEKVNQRLEALDRDLHIAQGRLQQVGGAVARDRLREAIEAYELARVQQREVETDYEAWKLLAEQLQQAEAAQASDLGRALAPAIEDRLRSLTRQRYGSIRLTRQLELAGVVAAGKLRGPDDFSVGTREQLATLLRLCLAEHLRTAIVLDDQLVQSDVTRMEWFRALLAEKARSFQIVVLTCRPWDYLEPAAMVTGGKTAHRDGDEGFLRAIDLERAVART